MVFLRYGRGFRRRRGCVTFDGDGTGKGEKTEELLSKQDT